MLGRLHHLGCLTLLMPAAVPLVAGSAVPRKFFIQEPGKQDTQSDLFWLRWVLWQFAGIHFGFKSPASHQTQNKLMEQFPYFLPRTDMQRKKAAEKPWVNPIRYHAEIWKLTQELSHTSCLAIQPQLREAPFFYHKWPSAATGPSQQELSLRLHTAAVKREPVCKPWSAHTAGAQHLLSSVVKSQKRSTTDLSWYLPSLVGSTHQSGKLFLHGQASLWTCKISGAFCLSGCRVIQDDNFFMSEREHICPCLSAKWDSWLPQGCSFNQWEMGVQMLLYGSDVRSINITRALPPTQYL